MSGKHDMNMGGKHDPNMGGKHDPNMGGRFGRLLTWYQQDASQALRLLSQIPEWENSTIFLPGVGTSVLIEELLSRGVGLVLNDISIEALNRVKNRLNDKDGEIVWLCQDIAHPIQSTLPKVDIWIDRAVLHFLTDENDINGYFENVKSTLKTGGHAIFAEFSKTGVRKCAGLTLHRYSIEELSERLSSSFKLISHFDYTYINPNGDPRPYVYALCQCSGVNVPVVFGYDVPPLQVSV